MKRTCNGCKAFGGIRENQCALGYRIEPINVDIVYTVSAKPLEECPKPTKTMDYFNLLETTKNR